MRRGAFVISSLLAAAPVLAQSAASLDLGRQVYRALQGDGTAAAATGALLRDSINGLGGICLNATSYQLFRDTEGVKTLKVECPGRPLYLLSVDEGGRMILSGGDSRVQPMEAIDGPVIPTAANAPAASEPTAGIGFSPRARNDAIPVDAVRATDADSAPLDPQGWMRWLFAAALGAAGIVALFVYGRIDRRMRTAGPAGRLTPFTSEEKDRMVAEARELRPDFYAHPSGLFIVRGRQGKRRLFPNRLYAYLYWRWGMKIAQIR